MEKVVRKETIIQKNIKHILTTENKIIKHRITEIINSKVDDLKDLNEFLDYIMDLKKRMV